MNKILFYCFCLLVPALHAAGQTSNEKAVFIIDSITIHDDPEEGNDVLESDIAELTVITNKDSLHLLGLDKFDRATYIFTKEYRNRPEYLKQIPSSLQMERTNNGLSFRGSLYTGKYIDYYYNGKKQREGAFKNGKPDGLVTMYFRNGNKSTEDVYSNGIPNGPEKEYYEDGSLKQKGVFVNGKEDGVGETYFPNGQVKQRSTFKEGKMEGETIIYYSSGKILAIESTKDGKDLPDKRLEKVQAVLNKGNANMKEADFKAAIKNYSKAIELDSSFAQSWFLRGRAKFNELLFDEAILDFNKALQLEPYMSEALVERAFTRIRKYQFTNNRQLTYSNGVTVLASRDKPEIPPGELPLICNDLQQGIFLGDKNKMIMEAVATYCKKQ